MFQFPSDYETVIQNEKLLDIEKGDRVNGTKFYQANDTNNNSNHNNNKTNQPIQCTQTASTDTNDCTFDGNKLFSCKIVHTNEHEHQPIIRNTTVNVTEEQIAYTLNAVDRKNIKNTKANHTANRQIQPNPATIETTSANFVAAPPSTYREYTDVYNDNDNGDGNAKLSSKVVNLLRRSKSIGIVVISCVLAVSIAITICTKMGWGYTIPAIVVGAVAIIASSGLWYWLYIAAVTAPRDIK